MKVHEVRDVIREQVGRDKLAEPMLDWCLNKGLSDIEKADNFYWMEASQTFELDDTNVDQVYSIKNDLMIPDYKDAKILLISDRSETDPQWDEVVGPEMEPSIRGNFADGESGAQPSFWSLREEGDDPSIVLWPDTLDQDYRAKLFYYRWTTLPTDANSTSHEVLRRWPEALIYTATAEGILLATKDVEQAGFWMLRFRNISNETVSSEYKKIKLYQEQRKSRKGTSTSPSNGATLTNRLVARQRMWF